MTDRNLPRPSGDTVEDGVPATEEVRDEVLRTGDTGVADMPMPDRPLGADKWGITEFEQRAGDSLDQRIRREEPEDTLEASGPASSADTLSAEEAAMHIVEDDDLRDAGRP